MAKEDIFSLIKVKNYNNALESILEKKDFTEDVKNLLLSMLYKVENAYEDYETVKVEVQTKNQYIKNLLNIISDCNEIVLAKHMSEEDEMLKRENRVCSIDENKGKIIVYQNEEMMLRAIQEIAPKQIIIKEKYNLYKKGLEELLTKGYIYNNVEVIRDFNGWSWDINQKAIEDLDYNLVYQNMLMIFGNEFINCIVNNCKEASEDTEEVPSNEILRSKYMQLSDVQEEKQNDYIELIEKKLEEKYGESLKNKIIESFKKLLLIIISNKDENERKKIEELKQENEQLLEKMQNKKEFVSEITARKKEIAKQIKKIDNVINEPELLKKEYEKTNKNLSNKEKIFSASQYANNLILKRKEYLEEINNINKIMEPKEFVRIKEEKENKKQFFEVWNTQEIKIEEYPFIVELQKNFLEALKIDIQNLESKNEILDIIYKLRYYKFLPYEDKKIGEIKELRDKIEEVQKILIQKACDKKAITRLSEDESINYEILKNIFSSKIITLENIIIILKYSKDKHLLTVEIYDGNIIENTEEIKIDKKTELSVKLKKKLKVFEK